MLLGIYELLEERRRADDKHRERDAALSEAMKAMQALDTVTQRAPSDLRWMREAERAKVQRQREVLAELREEERRLREVLAELRQEVQAAHSQTETAQDWVAFVRKDEQHLFTK